MKTTKAHTAAVSNKKRNHTGKAKPKRSKDKSSLAPAVNVPPDVPVELQTQKPFIIHPDLFNELKKMGIYVIADVIAVHPNTEFDLIDTFVRVHYDRLMKLVKKSYPELYKWLNRTEEWAGNFGVIECLKDECEELGVTTEYISEIFIDNDNIELLEEQMQQLSYATYGFLHYLILTAVIQVKVLSDAA